MSMKALITGANGFSGRHLSNYLKTKKVKVFGFRGDLKNKDNVFTEVKRTQPDCIFHLASPVLRSDKLLDKSLADNLEVDLFGTVYLIQAAADLFKKPKLLITGSNAEYAPSNKPLQEIDPLKPLTGYGLSKLTQEIISLKLCKSYGIPLIMTRTFHLIGPGQKPGFVVTDIAKTIAFGSRRITLGNSKVRRDFTDVRDAVRAYWKLIKQGKAGEVYNVCSGKTVSIGNIAAKLIKLSGRKIIIKQRSAWRKNDPDIICGNRTKITRLAGWLPKIGLDQSLKDTLNYWQNHA